MSHAPTLSFLLISWFWSPHESPAIRRKMSPHRRESIHDGPGGARQYSAGPPGGRGAHSGAECALQGLRDPVRILDLRVVPQVIEAGDRRLRPQPQHGVEDRWGGHWVEHPPRHGQRLLPISEGPMPAIRVTKALVHVTERLVVEGPAAPCADQGPLVLSLLIGERMPRGEDRPELLAEEALAREV